MAEAIKFRSAQELRADEDLERLRLEAERDHARIRAEEDARFRDHESRLRTLEKIAWTTLGTAGLAVVTSLLQLAIKTLN